MTRQTSVQVTEATDRQVKALTAQGFGTFTDVVRIAIDRMYRTETRKQEAREMDKLAEDIYGAVYGEIDSKTFHRDRVREIEDWLDDGEPVTGETVAQLARQWHQEHTGEDEITDALNADDWVAVELQFGTMSRADILRTLDWMMPTEENGNLAERIYTELH